MLPKTIQEINALSSKEFVEVLGNVIEHNPLCGAAVWRSNEPFKDFHDLHKGFIDFLDSLPIDGKKGVLRLYPDLAGKHAQEGTLTKESVNEHSQAGLFNLTDDERTKMEELNNTYKTKFGFTFVICARENKKETILKGLELRNKNGVLQEVNTGIEEVKKICLLRLKDIVDLESRL